MQQQLKYMAGFLLLFAAHLLGAANRAETDSTKSKYDLNDPRNPQCPCHQYQAQADKEYAQWLHVNGKNEVKLQKESQFTYNARHRAWGKERHKGFAGHRPKNGKIKKRKAFRDRLSKCFHF